MREGLTCIISVKVPNPEFEGQTKVLLAISLFNVYPWFSNVIAEVLIVYLVSCATLLVVWFVKTRLGNPEVRKVVDQAVQDYLSEYLELHPDVLDSILSKALNAMKVSILNIFLLQPFL